jgi:NAD(P)-dependent dehydrogenase (short-subunit alcohol dehydrogenase family)
LLSPRTVVVTGAAGGLGAATVRRLADRGWRVIAADLEGPGLQALASERVVPLEVDVTDGASVAALRDRVLAETDRLAGLVTFAGVLEIGSLVEIDEAAFRRVIDVNLIGTFLVVGALFPLIHRGGGRIVLMSSETGWQTAMPFNGPYAISKHAVEAYGDALRRELMFVGVPVVKIQPGAFRTGMVASILDRFERAADASEHFGDLLRKGMARIPKEQARAADPAELAVLIERVLTEQRVRPAYRIHTNPQTGALSLLPARVVDRVLKTGLQR